MSAEPNTRWSFKFNLDLVSRETRRWPVATTIVVTIIAALTAVQAINERHSDAIYVAVEVIGFLSVALGLKALLHLTTYVMVHREPFLGSHLVASGIVMIPLFVFYACAFYVMSFQLDESLPVGAVLIFLGVAYPLFTIFSAGALRAGEWIQLGRQQTHNKKPDSA